MSQTILSTDTLPPPIRERFSTQKITIKNYENGVVLLPLKDIALHRGIAKGSSFTTSTLSMSRDSERVKEDDGLAI